MMMRPYICVYDDCVKSYTQSWHLKRHIQAVHEADKNNNKYECPLSSCNKLFKTSRTLKKHIKNVHEKRKYVCATCSKTFRKNQHLKSHEYEHTGIKPFLCQHEGCGKRFIVPSKLKRHLKIHEGYKCDVFGCDAKLNTWTLLLQHRKTSHPLSYICDICKKKFKTRYNLQLHIKIHEEEREKFHCPYKNCPKFYLDKRNLLLHIKSCHEEHKYLCPHEGCNEWFAHKYSIRRHLKCHSEEYIEKMKSKRNQRRFCKGKKKKSRNRKIRDEAAYLSGFDLQKKDKILSDNESSKNTDNEASFELKKNHITSECSIEHCLEEKEKTPKSEESLLENQSENTNVKLKELDNNFEKNIGQFLDDNKFTEIKFL